VTTQTAVVVAAIVARAGQPAAVTHSRAGGLVVHPGTKFNCPKCSPRCRRTGSHNGHGNCPGVDFR
jgi:hypothetical protein